MGNQVARASRQGWIWAAVLLALGVGGYFWLTRSGGAPATPAEASPPARPRVVPVTAAEAKQGDLNHYLTALGTVTPFKTVTIKSRVDGQLIKVDFKEGQFVQEGQLLVEIDPRPFQVQLEQAEGQMARDRAALHEAKVDRERDKILYAHNVIAKQQLDLQQATVEQDQGAVVSDQSNIDNAKLQLTYSRITAPISGRIGLRLVDPGNIVHATDTQGLAVITQLQPIATIFSIPEDDLPKVLAEMQTGKLAVEAYDRGLTKKLATGRLLTTDNQIDTTTGTIRLKAAFPNTDNALFPNQFVNVKLLVETERDKVLIPTAAIQRTSAGTVVYAVRPDNTVDARTVAVGVTQGDLTSVDSGVKPGEMVVVDGLDKLQQGTRVSVQPATKAAGERAGP